MEPRSPVFSFEELFVVWVDLESVAKTGYGWVQFACCFIPFWVEMLWKGSRIKLIRSWDISNLLSGKLFFFPLKPGRGGTGSMLSVPRPGMKQRSACDHTLCQQFVCTSVWGSQNGVSGRRRQVRSAEHGLAWQNWIPGQVFSSQRQGRGSSRSEWVWKEFLQVHPLSGLCRGSLFAPSPQPILRSHLESSGSFGLFLIKFLVVGAGLPVSQPGSWHNLRAPCQYQLWLQLVILELNFTSCKSYQEKLLGIFFNFFWFLASLKFLPGWCWVAAGKGGARTLSPVAEKLCVFFAAVKS